MKKILYLISSFILFHAEINAQYTTLYDTVFIDDTSTQFEIIKREGLLENGLNMGRWNSWYSNGQLAESGEYKIVSNKEIRFIMDNSNITFDTIDFRNKLNEKISIPFGWWTTYNKMGQILSKGQYLDYPVSLLYPIDMLDENGEIQTMISIDRPKSLKTGIWELYDELTKTTKIEIYNQGILINE